MADWFTETFGAAADDIRAKLIDEAWFGRRTADHGHRGGLGWSLGDHPREPDPTPFPERGIDLDR